MCPVRSPIRLAYRLLYFNSNDVHYGDTAKVSCKILLAPNELSAFPFFLSLGKAARNAQRLLHLVMLSVFANNLILLLTDAS
jgi:hypothetical protein